MNRLEKIKLEFLEQFQNKLAEEKVDLSVESAFDILISADPSPNKKNVRWLIETYLDDGYLWEDISAGKHSKVYDTLNTFIRNKNKLDILDRSINRYESIADMWKMVKQYADDKTGKEVKREEYDKAMAESEIVIDNDDMRVVVPLTEYASKFHGRGTRWCTAADNYNQFLYYAKDAPLFIITLKESGDKLQLWKNGNNVQFMDADDYNVTAKYVQSHYHLLKPFIIWLGIIDFIPISERNDETIGQMLDYNCHDITNGFSINKLNCDTMKKLLKINGMALKEVLLQKEHMTDSQIYELCKIACEQDGNALIHIPEELKTFELCVLAIKNGTANTIDLVPLKFKTYDVYKMACQQNGLALKYVPEDLITPEFCKIAIDSGYLTQIDYIPSQFHTYEMIHYACEQNGWVLNSIDKNKFDFIDEEIYKVALKSNHNSMIFVPKEMRTLEFYEMALKINGNILEYIPEKVITKELCELAFINHSSIKYIPRHFRTPEMINRNKKKKECKISYDVYKQIIEDIKHLYEK